MAHAAAPHAASLQRSGPMRTEPWIAWARLAVVAALLLLGAHSMAWAQAGKLLAPLYPGATPIDDEAKKQCGETSKYYWEVCSQYAADTVDKVQAFYEGKIGKRFQAPRTAKADSVRWAPLAWYYSLGEDGEGDVFPGVTLRTRPVAPWPDDNTAAHGLMRNSQHFSGISGAVNWVGGTSPYMQGMHTPQDLKALYAK